MFRKMIINSIIKTDSIKFNINKLKPGYIVKHTNFNDKEGHSRYAIIDRITEEEIILIMWSNYEYLLNNQINIKENNIGLCEYSTNIGFMVRKITIEDILKGYCAIELGEL